jgi:hypothetical protein
MPTYIALSAPSLDPEVDLHVHNVLILHVSPSFPRAREDICYLQQI